MTVRRSVVLGIGSYLPAHAVSNAELAKRVDTSDEWIVQRTGIHERHIAAEGEFTSHLAINAAKAALENAGVDAQSIDLIVLATSTPDNTFPATAVEVQAALGITKGFAFDVQAVCSGFVFALATADQYLRNGAAKRALVIGAETFSRILDWSDRTTCVLFALKISSRWARISPARARIAASSPRICARMGGTNQSSTSMADRHRPKRSAICGWKARKCSNTRWR